MARPGERVWLSAEEERAIRQALAAGATVCQAAFLAGVPERLVETRFADQLSDCRVGRGRGRKRVCCDPSEAEIEAAKLEIRAQKGELPPDVTLPAPPAAER